MKNVDPFRGVFDANPWAQSGRSRSSGNTLNPIGPKHARRIGLDGSVDVGAQIAHRLSWWLTEMRLRAHFVQRELADYLDTTQPAIAKWESGRTLISLARLARFSDATGIPVALYFDLPTPHHQRGMWL